MLVKVSARALLDFLAGRINVDQFRHAMGQRAGEKNLFEHWLTMGLSLQDIKIESGGVDEDDDLLVLSLSDDPAARRLKLPSKGADENS